MPILNSSTSSAPRPTASGARDVRVRGLSRQRCSLCSRILPWIARNRAISDQPRWDFPLNPRRDLDDIASQTFRERSRWDSSHLKLGKASIMEIISSIKRWWTPAERSDPFAEGGSHIARLSATVVARSRVPCVSSLRFPSFPAKSRENRFRLKKEYRNSNIYFYIRVYKKLATRFVFVSFSFFLFASFLLPPSIPPSFFSLPGKEEIAIAVRY
jgi:hypothetical protein